MQTQEISSEAGKYLASALKHFEVEKPQVVKARIQGGELVMLWDRGVNGIAKDRVQLSELTARRARKPKADPAPATEK